MQLTIDALSRTEDQAELASILGCSVTDLATTFEPYATAAVEELTTMILGQKVFSRGSDIREYRLYLLIQHAFDRRIPDEQDVCKLFQCTATGARALIRAVMSKYQYLLKDAIQRTLTQCLGTAEVDDGDSVSVAIRNNNLVDELNRVLGEIDSSLPPVSKRRGSISTFEIRPSSYKRLCAQFGVTSILPADE